MFEGNCSDLRIGLPMQSLRHTSLRLSVFIEAPPEAIDRVMAAHEIVRQLVDGSWLTCFAWFRRAAPSFSDVERVGRAQPLALTVRSLEAGIIYNW